MNSKVSDMISSAFENIKGIINVDSIIGNPITTPDGTVILPVSKVVFGIGGGGSDIVNNNVKNTDSNTSFGGGVGGGASIQPEAFLVINNGNIRLIPMENGSNSVNRIIDMVPDMVDKVNGFFAGKKAAEENE